MTPIKNAHVIFYKKSLGAEDLKSGVESKVVYLETDVFIEFTNNSIETKNVMGIGKESIISEGKIIFDSQLSFIPISEFLVHVITMNGNAINKWFSMYDYIIPVMTIAPHEAKLKEEKH
jgi:hypothetical protein